MTRRTKASRRAAFRRANTIPASPVALRFDGRSFLRAARRVVQAFERAGRLLYLAVRRRLADGPPYFAVARPLTSTRSPVSNSEIGTPLPAVDVRPAPAETAHDPASAHPITSTA